MSYPRSVNSILLGLLTYKNGFTSPAPYSSRIQKVKVVGTISDIRETEGYVLCRLEDDVGTIEIQFLKNTSLISNDHNIEKLHGCKDQIVCIVGNVNKDKAVIVESLESTSTSGQKLHEYMCVVELLRTFKPSEPK